MMNGVCLITENLMRMTAKRMKQVNTTAYTIIVRRQFYSAINVTKSLNLASCLVENILL